MYSEKRRNYYYLIISQLLILYVSIANIFPEGYTFVCFDTLQFFRHTKIDEILGYTWSNFFGGQGSFIQFFSYILFYKTIFFLGSLLNLKVSQLSFFYYFLFLIISFWSAFLSIALFNKNVNIPHKVILSLTYTFNAYIFIYYSFSTSFSPYLSLYPILPLIFSLTYYYFCEAKTVYIDKSIVALGVVFFFINIPNGNLPFFIALNLIYFFYLFLLVFVFNKFSTWKVWMPKVVLIYVLLLLSTCWSTIPQISEMLRLVTELNEGTGNFDLGGWIIWQAVELKNVFFLTFSLDGYTSQNKLVYLAIFLFVIPFFSILIGRKKAILPVFLILIILTIVLSNKFKGILDIDSIKFIFTSNPILASLRSNDKILIFLPFLLIFTMVITYKKSREYIILMYLFFIFNLISAYPLFTGNMQTKYSVAYGNSESDYLSAKHSGLIKTPDEYYQIANLLNKEESHFKILELPYSVINSIGWQNYPKWKVIGINPITQLINLPMVGANSPGYSLIDKNYSKTWNEQKPVDSLWLLNFARLLNTKYLLFHKDVAEHFIEKTKGKILFYEREGFIKKVTDNQYFALYELDKQFQLPRIYLGNEYRFYNGIPSWYATLDTKSNQNEVYINKNDLPLGISKINDNNNTVVEFNRLEPTKYRVVIHGLKNNKDILVLSESFHSGWKLYPIKAKPSNINVDCNQVEQDICNYAKNGWLSNLGDGQKKEKPVYQWQNGEEILVGNKEYTVDYVSKLENSTIQNNNLSMGDMSETWLLPSLGEQFHIKTNGYSNGWVIDIEYLKKNFPQSITKNGDTYDIEFVAEFQPQMLARIGFFVSVSTLLICFLLYLGFVFKGTKK
jgi:hypothetical protein